MMVLLFVLLAVAGIEGVCALVFWAWTRYRARRWP
jgi:hypothetical protein